MAQGEYGISGSHHIADRVADVSEAELGRRDPGHRDAARIPVEPLEPQAGANAGVVEREESEAAAEVEHATALGQALAKLVEETLTENPESPPAVAADDPVLVRADNSKNGLASHRSGTRRPRRPVCSRARGASLRWGSRRAARSRNGATCP